MPADAVYNLRLLSITGIDDFLSIVFTNVARIVYSGEETYPVAEGTEAIGVLGLA